MKHLILSFATAFSIGLLSSCGGDSTSTQSTPEADSTNIEAADSAQHQEEIDSVPSATPLDTTAQDTTATVEPKPSSSLGLSRSYRSTRTFNSSSPFGSSSKFSTPSNK